MASMETARPSLAALWGKVSKGFSDTDRNRDSPYRLVVNLAREGDADGRRNKLFQQAADLASVVYLRSVRRRAEVVLGANSDSALLGDASHGASGADSGKGEVDVDADRKSVV